MKIRICCIAALLIYSATASARIGETEAQIEARYGRPTGSYRTVKSYSYNGFEIFVAFSNGKSGVETFQKRNHLPMSAVEIGTLLDANGGGTKWHQPIQQGLEFYYKEKIRFAEYNALTNKLTICEYGALSHVNQVNQVLDARAMKGF
jgi:hypothetical protein